MKTGILILLLCAGLNCLAQEKIDTELILELRESIKAAEASEKLLLMDSLATIILFEPKYKYETIANETIALAIEQNNLTIAFEQAGFLMDFYNNRENRPEDGLALFKTLVAQATQLKNNNLQANFYLNGGDSYYYTQDYENALLYYRRVQEYATRAKNKKLFALAQLYSGIAYSDIGSFTLGSFELQKAKTSFQELKDTFNIISASNSLSILYSQNSFFEEAEAVRNEAITLAVLNKSYGQLVSFYFNAASDFEKMNKQKDRIENLELALEYARNSKFEKALVYKVLTSLVIANAENGYIKKAENYLAQLEKGKIYTQGNFRPDYIDALKNLAFAKKDYPKAILLGEEHLQLKLKAKNYENLQNAEKFLADVYEETGDISKSYAHFKKYHKINDSVNTVQKVKSLSYYQTLYETQTKDVKISNQQNDIKLLDAKTKVQNQLLIFGSLSLVILFALILLVRSINFAKRRQRMQEGFSQELIKAQEEERTRVARELHDSVGQKLMLITKQTKSSGNIEMEQLAGSTLEELRSISRGLHPATLEKLGITAAVKSLINEVDTNTNIFFTNEIENIDSAISKETSLHLYRIIQEVLSNMVKHANAKAAFVTISKKENGSIEAIIKDNGKGFEYSEKNWDATSLGMKTLFERSKIIKSKLEIKSEINKGTTIAILIPN